MRVLITCGPSYEPIDRVRRITNFSTGELGILLANAMGRRGHDVVCLKGEIATTNQRLDAGEAVAFSTNAHLMGLLEGMPHRGAIGAVFHCAALCDFRVRQVIDAFGQVAAGTKISSRESSLTLELEPVPKLISEFRRLFPQARIVGWKYELDGTIAEVEGKARRQIADNQIDACVVNGDAYGRGFGFCHGSEALVPVGDKAALCCYLTDWVDSL